MNPRKRRRLRNQRTVRRWIATGRFPTVDDFLRVRRQMRFRTNTTLVVGGCGDDYVWTATLIEATSIDTKAR